MRKPFFIFNLVLGLVLSWNAVCAAEGVVVIPLLGDESVGNARPRDVLVGKTFSNSKATGLTGTRAHAPVEKTGQTGCWDSSGTPISCIGTGQDGEHQKGVPWPSPRFTANVDNNGDGDCDDVDETCDGTVTDNLTGLTWLKNADCPGGTKNWSDALTFANSLYDGWTGDPGGGDCELSDGSSAGDWRLANVKELLSLLDYGNFDPALPSGHPFTGEPSGTPTGRVLLPVAVRARRGLWSCPMASRPSGVRTPTTTYGQSGEDSRSFDSARQTVTQGKQRFQTSGRD